MVFSLAEERLGARDKILIDSLDFALRQEAFIGALYR